MNAVIEHERSADRIKQWDWTTWLRRVWSNVAPTEFDEPHCPHCGTSLLDAVLRKVKPRSLPQHKRLFKIISLAFEHWPEGNDEFQPDSEEHLRAWLICMAGPEYREVHRVYLTATKDCPEITPEMTAVFAASYQAVLASVRSAHKYSFTRPHPKGGCVAVYVPLSMSFTNMAHKKFCALNNAIEDVLRVVGLDPETLLMERQMAAK